MKEIEKLIFNFLWEAKDRIKRKTLIGDKTDGGLKMLDIFCKDKSLKAGWISRLSNNDSVNSCFLNMYLSKFGIDINYLIKSSVKDQCLYIKHLKLPKFWAEVFAYKDVFLFFGNTSNFHFLQILLSNTYPEKN